MYLQEKYSEGKDRSDRVKKTLKDKQLGRTVLRVGKYFTKEIFYGVKSWMGNILYIGKHL